MNNSEKKETVRQAIIRAVPSIMDLKMGCIVEYDNKTRPTNMGRTMIMQRGHQTYEYLCYTYGSTLSVIQENWITTIIGHPITLADVLVAMRVGHKEAVEMNDPSKSNWSNDVITTIVRSWDLSQDFDHQSEETIGFLWSLLCD